MAWTGPFGVQRFSSIICADTALIEASASAPASARRTTARENSGGASGRESGIKVKPMLDKPPTQPLLATIDKADPLKSCGVASLLPRSIESRNRVYSFAPQ